MSHLVDIALDESGRMTAVAAELRLARGTLFLLLESTSADPAAAALVQAALAAFVGTAACSPATSQARMLDQAFEAANRAAGDAIQRNRSLQGVLVSASAVLSTGDSLHVASVGANGVYMRTQGQTRRLAEPETPASRLALHGLSPDETRNVDKDAVNGLGLPPEVFTLRQSRTIAEPDSYLLVLCGAGIDSLITPAHISTTSPATGDMSVTATRLFRQFGDKLMTPSAVLAAHRRTTSVESTPFRYSIGTGERSSRRLAGPLPFALLALAVLGILVYLYLDRTDKDTPPPPLAPPVNLLQPGQPGGAGAVTPGPGGSVGTGQDGATGGVTPGPGGSVGTGQDGATGAATPGPGGSVGTGQDGATGPAAGFPVAPQSPPVGSGETADPLPPPSAVEPATPQGSRESNAPAPADGGEASPVEAPPAGKGMKSSRAGAGAGGPPAAAGKAAAGAPAGHAKGTAAPSVVPGSRRIRPQPVAPAAPNPAGPTDTSPQETTPVDSHGSTGEQEGAEPAISGLAGEGAVNEGKGAVNEGEGAVNEGEGAVNEGEGAVNEGEGVGHEGTPAPDAAPSPPEDSPTETAPPDGGPAGIDSPDSAADGQVQVMDFTLPESPAPADTEL